MFIYSVRASSVRFFGFIAIVLVLLFGAVSVLDGGTVYASSDSSVSYDGMSTDEARLAFVRQFGLEVDESSMTSEAFTMPDSFDRVILGYNELQKRQGLDLSKYAKKRVTRYTWRVTNYNCDGEVYANLFIYRGRVVACDVSSADPTGFVLPLTEVDRSMLK